MVYSLSLHPCGSEPAPLPRSAETWEGSRFTATSHAHTTRYPVFVYDEGVYADAYLSLKLQWVRIIGSKPFVIDEGLPFWPFATRQF
jgi:hypothetical protein